MKKTLACIVVAAALVPFGAQAGERVPDAGLGALAGGLAFGWQGAVAGKLGKNKLEARNCPAGGRKRNLPSFWCLSRPVCGN